MDRMLGFDMQTLISMGIILLNILALCFIVYKTMYGPVQRFLAERADQVSKRLDDTENDLKDAAALKVQYEEKISHIDTERTEILEVARKKALNQEIEILKKARAEAETIKDRAMLDIQREQAKVKDEIKQQMIEISTMMASRFVAERIDQATQNKLLEEALVDLEDAKWLA